MKARVGRERYTQRQIETERERQRDKASKSQDRERKRAKESDRDRKRESKGQKERENPSTLATHTKGRPLGGRVLSQMRAVDSVSLYKLISRGIRPEVIRSLHLGVFQSTGPHCEAFGAGNPEPPEIPTTTTTTTKGPPHRHLEHTGSC